MKKLIFITILSIFLITPSAVNAQEKTNGGLSVSPSIINLDGKAGERISKSFTFINDSDATQNISLEISSFVLSGGESGTPVFNDSDGNEIVSVSKDWIKLPELSDNSVAPGESKKIDFFIDIPKNAKGGKYNNAIFVLSESDGNVESGNKINYRIGTLVILDVEAGLVSNPYFLIGIAGILLLIVVGILIWKKRQ